MILYIIAGLSVVIVMFLSMKYLPEPGSPTKLDFVPIAGKRSNYFDCAATASDGSGWKSVGGVWEAIN